jgi:hypothetical protein
MIFYLSARFHGANQCFIALPEIDFTKGHQYQIEIRQRMFGRIQIQAVHGYENKPLEGTRVIYPDLFHFFKDWEPVQVAGAPGHFGGIHGTN